MTVLVPLALVAIATLHDLASREIPDWVAVLIFAWGLVIAGFTATGTAWTSLLLGELLGFALTAPLFWLGGIGGGDVKLVMALGACLGPWGLLQTLFWVALAGGVLALVAKCRGKSDFAYVPAILAGLVVYYALSGGLNHAP